MFCGVDSREVRMDRGVNVNGRSCSRWDTLVKYTGCCMIYVEHHITLHHMKHNVFLHCPKRKGKR